MQTKRRKKGAVMNSNNIPQSKPEEQAALSLSEISNKFARHIAEVSDSAVFGYVVGAIKLLESQGKDITKYAVINIANPMDYKDSSIKVTSQWRVVPISDLTNLPTFESEEL